MAAAISDLACVLEELAANAWPATVNQTLGGWRLRFAEGVTHRANSVWPNGWSGRIALEERLGLVEASYDRWGCPARYHISPAAQPANLDQALAERGYAIDAPSEVRVATIGDLLKTTENMADLDATVTETFTEPWLAAYRHAEGVDEASMQVRRHIHAGIGPLTAYVQARVDGVAVGTGMGVLERGRLGVFCMATQPDFRRQGVAKAVLRALALWARDRQGQHAYLQVDTGNRPAIALYEILGFNLAYRYHYRRKESIGQVEARSVPAS